MGIQTKNWLDWPMTSTQLDRAGLIGLETRVGNYLGAGAGPGVTDYQSFRVKQRAAGANMSVDVGQAGTLNAVLIPVDGAGGVQRYEYSGSQLNVAISSNASGLPRVDRIVVGAPTDPDDPAPQVLVLQGTPTAGATAANLSGAAPVAANRVLLADVEVASAAASILTANIFNRRAVSGGLPPIKTERDEVVFEPGPGLWINGGAAVAAGSHDNLQGAALMYLPRRIVGATRVRLRYRQGTTANAGQFAIGIYDASGRMIQSVGPTAFVGSAGLTTEAALTIAATTFEAGWYYNTIGIATMTASSSVFWIGPDIAVNSIQGAGPVTRNLALRSATGGGTLPATLAAYTDVGSLTADTPAPRVPIISLSVG